MSFYSLDKSMKQQNVGPNIMEMSSVRRIIIFWFFVSR
jgi:hypothetical protein